MEEGGEAAGDGTWSARTRSRVRVPQEVDIADAVLNTRVQRRVPRERPAPLTAIHTTALSVSLVGWLNYSPKSNTRNHLSRTTCTRNSVSCIFFRGVAVGLSGLGRSCLKVARGRHVVMPLQSVADT
eukprot:203367-Rhodomonas_salina.1